MSFATLNPVLGWPITAGRVEPENADVDDGTRDVLQALKNSSWPAPMYLPVKQVREAFTGLFTEFGLPPLEGFRVEEAVASGPNGNIRLRLHYPPAARAPSPALIYFHGGGMMTGQIETWDGVCQRIAREAGIVVVVPEYRLAPEHRFPAGVEDAYASWLWLQSEGAANGIDPARLAIGGDSAGGYLTAVLTQLCRERGAPPARLQIMIYPAVGTLGHGQSLDLFADGYFFSKDELAWTYAQYVGDAEQFADPRVQPIRASDFSGLPPALILTAGYDILRDEGEEYGALLRSAGGQAEVIRYERTIHAFLTLGRAIPAAGEAIARIAGALGDAL